MVEGPDQSKSDEVLQSKNEVSRKRGKEEKPATKVVIRRLPGSMTEQSFLEHVSPLFEHDYFYFVQGENPSFGDYNFSRAYINFLNLDDVYTFTMKFDDYVFLDSSGQEYPAVVEFAPFLRIPKFRNGRKNDTLCGTIEDDPDYQTFVQQLESEEQEHKPNQNTEHYFDLANDENEEKVTSTPLLEFLASRKNEWIKYKEEKKEERRRRDLERRKSKEENKRIKRESKELTKMKSIEKAKEEKRKEESKSTEEVKSLPSPRVRGKSYQEERQRDLARRKIDDKSGKGDAPENQTTDNVDKRASPVPENDTEKRDNEKESKDAAKETDSKHENVHRRKSFDEKKSHRDDDRKSYNREKDDRKHSFGVKKREYINGYENDSKYKGGKGYFYDDYKTRGHNSFSKNSYSSKYNSNKGKDYDEKKRFEKTKKYDGDFKDSKKGGHSWESRRLSDGKDEKKAAEKGTDSEKKSESREAKGKIKEVSSDCEPVRFKERGGDKRDERAERRIKNKDRPAMEIYRPGMGKFSRQRLERNKSTDSKDGE